MVQETLPLTWAATGIASSGNDVPRTPGSADTRKRTTPKSLPSGRPSQYGLTSPNPQQLEDLVNCAVEREMTKRLNGTPQMHSQRLPPPDEGQRFNIAIINIQLLQSFVDGKGKFLDF